MGFPKEISLLTLYLMYSRSKASDVSLESGSNIWRSTLLVLFLTLFLSPHCMLYSFFINTLHAWFVDFSKYFQITLFSIHLWMKLHFSVRFCTKFQIFLHFCMNFYFICLFMWRHLTCYFCFTGEVQILSSNVYIYN